MLVKLSIIVFILIKNDDDVDVQLSLYLHDT